MAHLDERGNILAFVSPEGQVVKADSNDRLNGISTGLIQSPVMTLLVEITSELKGVFKKPIKALIEADGFCTIRELRAKILEEIERERPEADVKSFTISRNSKNLKMLNCNLHEYQVQDNLEFRSWRFQMLFQLPQHCSSSAAASCGLSRFCRARRIRKPPLEV